MSYICIGDVTGEGSGRLISALTSSPSSTLAFTSNVDDSGSQGATFRSCGIGFVGSAIKIEGTCAGIGSSLTCFSGKTQM